MDQDRIPSIPDKFLKPYDPAATEERIYSAWLESGFFNPDNLPKRHKKPFTIIMPPPNANGHLHAGHALFITLEDIMIRYKRMRGYKALWVPGADHAGFETQIVYEKQLEKEGRSRFKMDPAELYKEIMAFTLENKKHMEAEVRSIGASCDWSRERFTLDADIVTEVQKTFKKMFDDKLVYRGTRLVNWCTKHQTSLSDVETESKEFNDTLYYIQYGPLVVATVRPETIFGDVAVAVNPKDERYKKYIGTEIEAAIPTGILKLKVVGDDSVDLAFGTGALKITPAHDKNDFELAQRHALPSIEVIDRFGKLNDKTGKYQGLKIAEARKKVSEDLTAMGAIVKAEPYKHSVPVCYKCETIIEPRLIPQWFVKMAPLADMALKAVKKGKIDFIPDNYRKIFTYWMEHPMDWNISRQIVWGISIPAKICDSCGFAAPDLEDKISKCPKCNTPLRKDTDTFDTWFSSGQWPLLTLNFPKGKDFKAFYPTDVMETGSDLIFKWVPRMVIFGLYLAKEVPFKTVYLHGLVNDAQGRKMSKSKGNVINPLDITKKYGTDALRIGIVIGNTPGNDFALSEDKIRGYKNFSNKIWNIARYVLSSIEDFDYSEKPKLTNEDKAAIKIFDVLLKDVTDDMDNFRFHLAGEKLYAYVWHEFADKIIEQSKEKIFKGDATTKKSAQYMLVYILEKSLRALHPFMPFVTEEIWSDIPHAENLPLMISMWPS
jgi:valyl-tRNA synthetase